MEKIKASAEMELDFFDELPTVFNILKFNPGAVVDDTAIERLLSWLEEMSAKKGQKLILKSTDFFESDEVWMNSMTLSFALRFAGYIGYNYSKSEEKIINVIKKMLSEITSHKQFSEASVQYGFYKCLNSLSKDIHWFEFLNEFLTTTFETFRSSYLFVQKAAVEFFASLLITLLKDDSNVLYNVLRTIESLSDPKQLYQVVESILLVSKTNVNMFLKFLSTDKLVKKLMEFIKSSQDKDACGQLFKSLTSLFSILTKPASNVDWYVTLSSESPEDSLIDFIRIVKSRAEFQLLVPSFCSSLMLSNADDGFSSNWNYKLLQFALSDIACHDTLTKEFESEYLEYNVNVTAPKVWKNILVVILGEMINIENKIQSDLVCSKLLLAWKHYCLSILTVSLSNDSERQMIDNNLITVMHDKKVPRLCFRYLKDTGFHIFDKELKEEFLDCLWNCLFCITDNSQLICATLELLSKYISQIENLVDLFEYSNCDVNKSLQNASYSLPDILNKLLWDTNWEVQDSLIDVLMVILEKAKNGSQICYDFLSQNTFWIKVIDLINNLESYIRSKTVTFTGAIGLYKSTWNIFCEKGNHTLDSVFKLFERIFTSEERQDDMFTRRSVLFTLKSWVLSELDYLPVLTVNCESDDQASVIKTCLINILENGSRDFDWEVRKLTFMLWADMATVISERSEEKDFFIDYVIDNNFALILCNGICDCEYLVKVEAFKCLVNIKDKFILKGNMNSSSLDIQSITKYEETLNSIKTMNRSDFVEFLANTDFNEVGKQIDTLDVTVTTDPVSFIQDVIASARQSEANLLDCY